MASLSKCHLKEFANGTNGSPVSESMSLKEFANGTHGSPVSESMSLKEFANGTHVLMFEDISKVVAMTS